eukprot:TRINITY_DN36071_c0_g1_i1.p1 TRINITY_DN36071_c0_g1~~TRINITY_DN36071_c0_g1_i1.p1  ORF type:complete len:287 (+),score=14.63 TRINITY_DN36071_c0_g1_i1:31-891(+)
MLPYACCGSFKESSPTIISTGPSSFNSGAFTIIKQSSKIMKIGRRTNGLQKSTSTTTPKINTTCCIKLRRMVDQLYTIFNINSQIELEMLQLPYRYLNIYDDMLEIRKISETDPRYQMRGRAGVFTTCPIQQGTVLGMMRGLMFKTEELQKIILHLYDRRVMPIEEADMSMMSYLYEMNMFYEGLHLSVCQLGYGNLLSEVNDPHINPYELSESEYSHNNWGAATQNQFEEPNVDILYFLIAGFPIPVMVSTKDISEGQELLTCYGTNHWTNMKIINARYKQPIEH